MDAISVHDIILDRGLNPRRQGVDQEIVEYYASIFRDVIWPPILVHRDTRKLLDGWHRVEAAQRAGIYALPVQWADAEEECLFALAVKANLGHGMRLTREDRYQAILRLQREGWNPERIIDTLGCSPAMVERTEKADGLRVRFTTRNLPGAALPMETLAEISRLPDEYLEEIAELAVEIDATPSDVRRTVRAIKREEVESAQDIRRVMCDPEFARARHAAMANAGGNWLMTFSALVDQLEASPMSIAPNERDAATSLYRRLRDWASRRLTHLGVDETAALL